MERINCSVEGEERTATATTLSVSPDESSAGSADNMTSE